LAVYASAADLKVLHSLPQARTSSFKSKSGSGNMELLVSLKVVPREPLMARELGRRDASVLGTCGAAG
jgi:hypothetical protein